VTRDEWARVEGLFDEARERPTATRGAWLASAGADAETRALVLEMLDAYDADPAFLEGAHDVVGAVAAAVADGLLDQRLGAYRIVARIGQGGMGVVYEAVRDDDDFARRVAIKVLPSWGGAALAERFRFERRVLATLDHPGISRLIDSGATADGAPYFVMEYVDGQPIDQWCRLQRLDLRARVALVEQVCGAVAYAHQHLVVHRDVKPANILVQPDGQPKLLDFGIATLLAEDGLASPGLTRPGHQTFTIDFASPEQIRGEAVTTASDVYSLGVLLYLLTAGQRPYSLQGLSPLEAMRTVCEVDPPRPSTVAAAGDRPGLRGALDAIIGTALRKSVTDRYVTVAALAADLQAWRAGLPVTAAPETSVERGRRFVRRHAVAVASATMVMLAVVAGGSVAVWQARVAAAERDKAQNRFEQVREFSRSLLFDVTDALGKVPGNTEPRRLVVDRAVKFLDGLAVDAGDDDALARELIEGYQRLGAIQGDVRGRNVGDAAGAAVSFEKGLAIAERQLARRPADVTLIDAALASLSALAIARSQLGEADARDRAYARHLQLVQTLERNHAGDPGAVARAAMGYSDAGMAESSVRNLEAARALYERSAALYESLPAAERASRTVEQSYAFLLKRLGAVLLATGQLEESERRYRAALAIDEALVGRAPGDAEIEYALTFTLSDLGAVLQTAHQPEEATALWRRALEIRRRAVTAEPKDVRALGGVATILFRLAALAQSEGQYVAAVAGMREALELRQRLVDVVGRLPRPLSERAWAALTLAEALLARATAAPADPARPVWTAEATRLLKGLGRDDVTASGVMGNADEFGPRLDAALAALPH